MPVGFTNEGYPYIGDKDAPIVLEEWSDYLCPYCGRHFRQTLPALLERYVATGEVLLVFRDFPLKSLHPLAPAGHAAAACMGEQGASLYWAMHDELFKRQKEWKNAADPDAFLVNVAEEIGADHNKVRDCMDKGGQLARVEQNVALGRSMGFHGTPSFRFRADDDRKYEFAGAHPIAYFSLYADALLEGREPPGTEQETAESPFWASAEG
ncbi:MAG: thioredoxin domain-containing protein, partial [Pseudomonadales bacterium]|nr:thioredoxin domain-containing protein [Pseudomonadales bacterium]